jgi:hypothetical protein
MFVKTNPAIYKFVNDNKRMITDELNKIPKDINDVWFNHPYGFFKIRKETGGVPFLRVETTSSDRASSDGHCHIFKDGKLGMINSPIAGNIIQRMFLEYQRSNAIRDILK